MGTFQSLPSIEIEVAKRIDSVMVCMLLHELILKRQSRGGHAHKPHQVKEIFQSSAVLDFELIGLK